MKTAFISLAILCVLGLVIMAASIAYTVHWYNAESDVSETHTVTIPAGSGVSKVTQLLQDNGVLSDGALHAKLYKAMLTFEGAHTQIKAGEYAIPAHASPATLTNMLVQGKSITHAITIPEGWRSAQVVEALRKDDRLKGVLPSTVAEGSILPETYHFHRGDSRMFVLQRMQAAQDELIARLWPDRAPNLPITTPEQAIILASIVEKETGVDGERGKVASVFTNRLRINMLLQTDPTVQYGVEQEDGLMDRPLWKKDLRRDTPYNTYIHKGLTPTPIANPGKAAIKAVLNPPTTPYFYFVATGNGGHHFSKTLAEHNAYVAQYRAIMRQKTQ